MFFCAKICVGSDIMNLQQIELYAKENNVPIMEKEGIEFLTNFIKENNITNILEIGAAIGYSAIRMCLIDDKIKVTTIERDKERYDEAVKNIKSFNLDGRINIIFGDALDIDVEGKFDLIFIDAAKSQSIKFFTKYEKNLDDNGFIITDNINFHGLTFSDKPAPTRNLRQMIRKIHNYLDWLNNNKDYITEYKNIGDGVTVSRKK
jgi:predicted O-methyltransferase YrrM